MMKLSLLVLVFYSLSSGSLISTETPQTNTQVEFSCLKIVKCNHNQPLRHSQTYLQWFIRLPATIKQMIMRIIAVVYLVLCNITTFLKIRGTRIGKFINKLPCSLVAFFYTKAQTVEPLKPQTLLRPPPRAKPFGGGIVHHTGAPTTDILPSENFSDAIVLYTGTNPPKPKSEFTLPNAPTTVTLISEIFYKVAFFYTNAQTVEPPKSQTSALPASHKTFCDTNSSSYWDNN